MGAQIVWLGGDTTRVSEIYINGQLISTPDAEAVGIADIAALLDRLASPGDVYTYGASKLGFWLLHSLATDAGEQSMADTIATVALESHDVMVDFAATHGYYASLRSFTGDVPPSEGLAKLLETCTKLGYLDRTTMAGKKQRWLPAEADDHTCHVRTTAESLRQWMRAPPNTKWMTGDPPTPAGDFRWLCTRLPARA